MTIGIFVSSDHRAVTLRVVVKSDSRMLIRPIPMIPNGPRLDTGHCFDGKGANSFLRVIASFLGVIAPIKVQLL